MLIDALSFSLEKSQALTSYFEDIDAGRDTQLSIGFSGRAFMAAAQFSRKPQCSLIVLAGEDQAYNFSRSLAAYLGSEKVLYFPSRPDIPARTKPEDPCIAAKRCQAMHALAQEEPICVVASAQALVRKIAPKSARRFEPIVLKSGSDLTECRNNITSFDDLIEALISIGFTNTEELEGPGSFCVRGGVIDIFPGTTGYPVRLDFFGDELEEIRRLVPHIGQTIASIDNIALYPVSELILKPQDAIKVERLLQRPSESNPHLRELLAAVSAGRKTPALGYLLPKIYDAVTLGDYLGKHSVSVLLEPRSLMDDARHAYEEAEKLSQGSSLFEGVFASLSELNFGSQQQISFVSILKAQTGAIPSLNLKRVDIAGDYEKLFGKLKSLTEAGYTVVLSAPNFRARQDLKLDLVDRNIAFVEQLDVIEETKGSTPVASRLRARMVNVVDVDIPLGMIMPAAKLALISLNDTQGSMQQMRTKRVDITQVTFPYQPGDYVVHASHGIALFKDMVTREIDGITRDYLLLEYDQDDKLYVPVEQFDKITRYVGPEGSHPRLTRLNTSDWARALQRASKATKKLAFDLVEVYARRSSAQGFRYSPDNLWQQEMEEAFPYQETPDQLAAIEEIKADMCSSKPMDRLVCGDVGFGKTEVALRAAFKATQDNKQVMVLCPTTILAQQHFITFKERFEPFDVSVEVISRFRSPAQIKAALEGFAQGTVQVLVGTHRLLSRDVNPHDLGLIIIDEEQRFGVGHKEQIKNLRESIDVLTLSATPIPRTMQMSLSGVRDMSLIMTPPPHRQAVEVTVGEWDPDVVSAAIRRELERKGQVYYVSNRVKSIEEALERVQAVAPEARIGVAHGQMSKLELERVMEDFSAGDIDVLVATTIIESGIDNPHTNTLIVEDAQRLGLAQMYQLKGRVGRSSTKSYAYFMFPEHVHLTEEATARLMAIGEHAELGSGMKIALRDLEIRGAGSLLGAEQSGNMSQVGFDLFAQMLAQAVAESKEGASSADAFTHETEITINLPIHAFISADYLPETDKRVLLYRRLASACSTEEVQELVQEATVLYGSPDTEAQNFFDKAALKVRAQEAGIQLISVVAGKLIIEGFEPTDAYLNLMRKYGLRYLEAKKRLTLPMSYFAIKDANTEMLEALSSFISGLVEECTGKLDATDADIDAEAPFDALAQARVKAKDDPQSAMSYHKSSYAKPKKAKEGTSTKRSAGVKSAQEILAERKAARALARAQERTLSRSSTRSYGGKTITTRRMNP